MTRVHRRASLRATAVTSNDAYRQPAFTSGAGALTRPRHYEPALPRHQRKS